MEICRTRRRVVFTWPTPDSWTKQDTEALHLWHPLPRKLTREKCSCFMQESFVADLRGEGGGEWCFPECRIHSLVEGLRTRRHTWKELSVPGRERTKPLLLELGQSSLTWKPHSSSGFGELQLRSHKAQLNKKHTVFGGWLGTESCEVHHCSF